MKENFPAWASKKQKEGMKLFLDISNDYGNFDCEFNNDDQGEHNDFIAVVIWENINSGQGIRKHKFHIAFDYEETWNYERKRVYEWQFVFAGGETARELTTEMFFIDIFYYVDNQLIIKSDQETIK